MIIKVTTDKLAVGLLTLLDINFPEKNEYNLYADKVKLLNLEVYEPINPQTSLKINKPKMATPKYWCISSLSNLADNINPRTRMINKKW